MSSPRRAEIIDALWRRSRLRYQLLPHQKPVMERFDESSGRIFVLCCNRRWGKSRALFTKAVECALGGPNRRIPYAAPTMKMAREIVVPHAFDVLAGCPTDLAPTFNKTELKWEFPNGSVIVLAGVDNGNHSRLRGTSADLALVDEAGFIDELRYVVQDVLLPQFITTGGRLFMASTPARSPVHDFTDYCLSAEAEGRYVHNTIYDCTHIPPNIIEEYMLESGGAESSTWQREYLAMVVVDEDIAVLPEFTREIDSIVREVPRPQFFDHYTSIDAGFHDLTAGLVGYYDFPNARLVVEDERFFQHANSATIAPAILEMEREHYGDSEPRQRVVDADAIVRSDLTTEHGLVCQLPRKDDKHAGINSLRVAIGSGRVVVHPRCKTLVAHCKGAIWNKQRTSFERSGTFGHFDGVDALLYMWRSVDQAHNPRPRYVTDTHDTHWIPPDDATHEGLAAITARKRRRR